MIKVILDTNFLIYCAKNKMDYASEIMKIMDEGYELVVPEQVISELNELSKSAKKYDDKLGAKIALKILELNSVKILPVRAKYADDALIRLSKEDRNIVATMDLELRKKVFRAILINGKKKLVFD